MKRKEDVAPPEDWLGPTPWEDVAEAYDEKCPDGYRMTLPSYYDAVIAVEVINQGIDNHLEALSFVDGGEPRDDPTSGDCLTMCLDKHGLLVFLRRLVEYSYGEAVDEQDERKAEWAESLRSSILQSLGIEGT